MAKKLMALKAGYCMIITLFLLWNLYLLATVTTIIWIVAIVISYFTIYKPGLEYRQRM